MDLNYLFHRQQVERSMAAAAASDEARQIHEQLARQYEARIERMTSERFNFPDQRGTAVHAKTRRKPV